LPFTHSRPLFYFQEGKISGDNAIGRALFKALSALPLPSTLDSTSFEKLFNENLQDLLMVMYLANITRTQLAVSNKINLFWE
jgi:translation initiation factor 3 subunit F